MSQSQPAPQQGELHWRLSSHPVTLLTFLSFRICMLCLAPSSIRALTSSPASLLVYLFGSLFGDL